MYPYDNWAADANIGSRAAQRYNASQDCRREGYIKCRQTTSQEGLRELVEWMEELYIQWTDSGQRYAANKILTKANEILNR